jgi:hypothetical protein
MTRRGPRVVEFTGKLPVDSVATLAHGLPASPCLVLDWEREGGSEGGIIRGALREGTFSCGGKDDRDFPVQDRATVAERPVDERGPGLSRAPGKHPTFLGNTSFFRVSSRRCVAPRKCDKTRRITLKFSLSSTCACKRIINV